MLLALREREYQYRHTGSVWTPHNCVVCTHQHGKCLRDELWMLTQGRMYPESQEHPSIKSVECMQRGPTCRIAYLLKGGAPYQREEVTPW